MNKIIIIATLVSFVSCKTPHPWLAVRPLQDGEVGIVKYKMKSKKSNARQYKEALEVITNYCQHHKLIRTYSSSTEIGSSITPNGYGGYNTYKTSIFYLNIEFKCEGDLSNKDEFFKYLQSGKDNLDKKNYSQAMIDYNKAIELKPDNALGYFNRGSLKSEMGDFKGEIEDCNKAIELKQDFSMAYNNRGWAKFNLKDYIEALKDFNKAIELDSKNWVAYDSRQETKFILNDYDGCLEDCNKAIELNSKLANAYFFKGKVYFKKEDKKKACENWSKAGQYGKMDAYELIKQNCN